MCGGEKRGNTRGRAAHVHDVTRRMVRKIGFLLHLRATYPVRDLSLYKPSRCLHATYVKSICLLCTVPSLVDYSIPLAGVHRRSGEQVSETSTFDVLHREKAAIRFLGSASRDCSLFVRDGSPSSSLACFVPS